MNSKFEVISYIEETKDQQNHYEHVEDQPFLRLGVAHRVTYFLLVLSDFHSSFAHSARHFIPIL